MRLVFCLLVMMFAWTARGDDFCLPGYMVIVGGNEYGCSIICPSGTYLANKNDTECTNVGPGYWAPESVIKQGNAGTRNKCPTGMTTAGYGAGADEESDCGYALHIGDSVLHLSSSRISVPGLNFLYKGKTYYAGATKLAVDISDGGAHTLNVMDKNRNKYFIYDTTLKDKVIELSTVFDVNDYVMEDGKILSANPNVYIESTGGQYINTHATGSTQYKYEIDYKLTDEMKGPLWGMRSKPVLMEGDIFCYTFTNIPKAGSLMAEVRTIQEAFVRNTISNANNLLRAHILIDIPNSIIYYNDTTVTMVRTASWETEYDLYLFNNNVADTDVTQPVSAKVYSYKVYDADDNLIMHMVPVPRGLIVGDFKVPSSGMWDIVTQTYYPNAGDGFFLYGKDE